jgi:hypothetical protein
MIDADSGDIHLPNGFVVTPALTLREFRQSWFGQDAVPNYPRSEPQHCWFWLAAGVLDSRPVSVQLSFDKEVLDSACLTAEIAEDSQEELRHWLDMKSFHDDLLRSDMGEPDTFTGTSDEDTPGLDKAPNHLRPWGRAVSEFDYGGGDAYISVQYNQHYDQQGRGGPD